MASYRGIDLRLTFGAQVPAEWLDRASAEEQT